MTTEASNEQTTTPETPELTEKQLSAVEAKAIEQGWRPKEDFEGDEAEFIDAPEFVRRGELFSKIEHQSKEVKQLRQALEALKDHHSKTKETEYKRALKQLEASRRAAVVDGEHETAFAIEEKIKEVQEEKQEFDAQVQSIPTAAAQADPVFTSWQANNSWYGKDKAMTVLADELGKEYRQEVLAGAMTKEDVFNKIAKEVRSEFKHKFQNPKTERGSAVESSSRGGRSNYSGGFQLSDDERTIMRKFVSSGVMTEKEYVAELKAQREV